MIAGATARTRSGGTPLGVADVGGRVMGETDAGRRLELIAHLNRRQWEIGQDVLPMLEAAAASDAEVARMLAGWKDVRAGGLVSAPAV
jgi:hypothetical protein